MNRDKLNKVLSRIPVHFIIIGTILIWIIPTLGLLITSFRPVQDVNRSGWWEVFISQKSASGPYAQYCELCHGADGKAIPQADLTNPSVTAPYGRSLQLLALLRQDFNGQPHMAGHPLPPPQEAADIAKYMKNFSATAASATPRFTLSNYIDALVGYRGRLSYAEECAAGTQPLDLTCNFWVDLLNPLWHGKGLSEQPDGHDPCHGLTDPDRCLCRLCLFVAAL